MLIVVSLAYNVFAGPSGDIFILREVFLLETTDYLTVRQLT